MLLRQFFHSLLPAPPSAFRAHRVSTDWLRLFVLRRACASFDTAGNPGSARQEGPPRKKLSCVVFADNTQVLITGDSSGHVDVYRIVGLTDVGAGGSSDALASAAGGAMAAAEGSEEHEAQLEALQAVLSGFA